MLQAPDKSDKQKQEQKLPNLGHTSGHFFHFQRDGLRRHQPLQTPSDLMSDLLPRAQGLLDRRLQGLLDRRLQLQGLLDHRLRDNLDPLHLRDHRLLIQHSLGRW